MLSAPRRLRSPLIAAASLAALSASFAALPQAASAQLSFTYSTYTIPDADPSIGSLAYGISASGTAVGTYVDRSTAFHGYVRSNNGAVTTFDYTGDDHGLGSNGAQTYLYSVNSAGDIIGEYDALDAKGNYQGFEFLYHNGAFSTPGGAGNYGFNNVNEAGLFPAIFTDASGFNHSTIYDIATGLFTPVSDQPGFDNTYLQTVAANGDLLINAANVTGGVSGVLRHNGASTFLNYPGATSTAADAITSSGLISGNYGNADGSHGFVYDSAANHWYSIDVPGSVYTTLRLGNSENQFVGWWNDANGGYHSLIVTAVPEPGAVALFMASGLSGIGMLAGRRRRRKLSKLG